MQKLMDYNMLIVTEWMTDPEYWQGIMRMFDDYGTEVLSTPQNMFCGKKSKYSNALFPAILRNETLDKFKKENQLDVKLFNELTNCPDGVVVFPPFSLGA
jgi:hypothetical protein